MIAAKAQLPQESFRFFLRRQLLSIITCYIESEHYRYAYISLESILTPSYTLLTPIGDGHRSPCLVTSCVDEHKAPHLRTHAYTLYLNIYKIILSIFTPNKIQKYYNKTVVFPCLPHSLIDTNRSMRSVPTAIFMSFVLPTTVASLWNNPIGGLVWGGRFARVTSESHTASIRSSSTNIFCLPTVWHCVFFVNSYVHPMHPTSLSSLSPHEK